MVIFIYTIVIVLLVTLLVTLGNVVFSVSELKDKPERSNEVNMIKIGVFMIVKIFVFALIINLIMYTLFGRDSCYRNNNWDNALILLVSFQIIFESISINKTLFHTMKKVNSTDKSIHELLEDNVDSLYSRIIYFRSSEWFLALGLNIITLAYILILMVKDNFDLFHQNMMIYFIIILYVKYLTIDLYKNINDKLKKSKNDNVIGE